MNFKEYKDYANAYYRQRKILEEPSFSGTITLKSIPYEELCSIGSGFDINRIIHNSKKKTTVVIFKPHNSVLGDSHYKIKVKCAEGDEDNVVTAVCAAVMKRKHKTNSAFKAHIRKKYGDYNDWMYQLIARYETGKIYDSFKKFEKIVRENLEEV